MYFIKRKPCVLCFCGLLKHVESKRGAFIYIEWTWLLSAQFFSHWVVLLLSAIILEGLHLTR
jgi:hypothetical protein